MSEIIKIKSVQSRYVTVDEDTFEKLSAPELKVYLALRFESDYSQKFSEVERTIEFIMEKSNQGRSTVFRSLLALETVHFLIQRLNYKNFKHGQTNSFNVARDYNFFKLIDNSIPVPQRHGCTKITYPSHNGTDQSHNGITIDQYIYQNKKPKEKEKEKEKSMDVIDLTPQKNENENGEEMKREYSVGPFDASLQQKEKETGLDIQDSQIQMFREDNNLISQYNLENRDLLAFDVFWETYPSKKNKLRARELWFSSGCHKNAGAIILKLTEQIVKDKHFLDGYIPSMCNYISGRRWEDEIEEKKSKTHFDHKDMSWALKPKAEDDIFGYFQ